MNNFFYKSKAIKCYFRLIKLVIENDILTKFKYKKLVNNFASQKSEMHYYFLLKSEMHLNTMMQNL